jgi:cytochrome c oxidase subunit 4
VLKPMLAPILLTLSALKFALVAMFYMHLKFDNRLFSWVFVGPLCFAAAIILALLALFSVSHRN